MFVKAIVSRKIDHQQLGETQINLTEIWQNKKTFIDQRNTVQNRIG